MLGLKSQVLVVDDEWMIRQQLSRALSSVGVRCDCAVDGDDALTRFIHHPYDLIVTDLRMPERNGHSLAVSLLDRPDPPIVIALTGVREPRLANDLLARGVAKIAFKPINFFNLADQIKCMLPSAPSHETIRQWEAERGGISDDSGAEDSQNARRQIEQILTQSPPDSAWLTTSFEWIDWERFPNPPVEVRDVLHRLAQLPSHAIADSTCEGRAIFSELAVAITLTSKREPVGRPFKVMVRDLSAKGIGLVHTEELRDQTIAISWRGLRRVRIIVVARVLRCRQVGDFFDIGAMLIQ